MGVFARRKSQKMTNLIFLFLAQKVTAKAYFKIFVGVFLPGPKFRQGAVSGAKKANRQFSQYFTRASEISTLLFGVEQN